MRKELGLATLLFAGCPKSNTALDFSQPSPQILAQYLRQNHFHSERYDGLYLHSYESVQGSVTLYYKPAGTEVVDTTAQNVLFGTNEEYFHDVFIFAPTHPAWNYVDIDADGTLDYIVDIAGQRWDYASFSSQQQENYSAAFELGLFEFVERLQRMEERK